MKKISICTVCMNRLSYLSQTLPVNIAENMDFPNLEFVVLNYNSKDDMDDWIKINMGRHIESGLLKYYKTNEPEYFSLAHSKNMATKLATGDIICNLDADNYGGLDYIKWVAGCFAAHGPDIIITTIRKDAIPYRDQGGKLCFSKKLFNAVNGYDESLIGYGMDDVDLANRIENAGCKRLFIEEEKFLQYIGHSDQERVVNYQYPNNLKSIYVCISESFDDRQKVLYLFKDNSAAEMDYIFNESIKSNLVTTFVGWTVEPDGHRKAFFNQTGNKLVLSFPDHPAVPYHAEDGILTPLGAGTGLIWKEITKKENMYDMFLMGYNECLNRLRYAENDRQDTIINEKGWGQGTVYLNFNTADPLPVL